MFPSALHKTCAWVVKLEPDPDICRARLATAVNLHKVPRMSIFESKKR